MKLRKTSTAIIVHNDNILFFKRDNTPSIPEPDKWQFPGGHIEKGESAEKALKRELKEEVGYISRKITYLGKLKNSTREVNVFWSYVNDNEATKFVLGNTEGQEIRFVNVDDALKMNLTKNVKFYMTNYQNILKKHLKNHTVPSIEELKKSTNILKFIYFKLTNL